jgi:hypothetical protein
MFPVQMQIEVLNIDCGVDHLKCSLAILHYGEHKTYYVFIFKFVFK